MTSSGLPFAGYHKTPDVKDVVDSIPLNSNNLSQDLTSPNPTTKSHDISKWHQGVTRNATLNVCNFSSPPDFQGRLKFEYILTKKHPQLKDHSSPKCSCYTLVLFHFGVSNLQGRKLVISRFRVLQLPVRPPLAQGLQGWGMSAWYAQHSTVASLDRDQ